MCKKELTTEINKIQDFKILKKAKLTERLNIIEITSGKVIEVSTISYVKGLIKELIKEDNDPFIFEYFLDAKADGSKYIKMTVHLDNKLSSKLLSIIS